MIGTSLGPYKIIEQLGCNEPMVRANSSRSSASRSGFSSCSSPTATHRRRREKPIAATAKCLDGVDDLTGAAFIAAALHQSAQERT